MTLKYQDIAKHGDRIRSYDFHGRTDCYVEGEVVSITNHPYAAFIIECDREVWQGKDTTERVGTQIQVPMEIALNEYDGRIVNLSQKEGE